MARIYDTARWEDLRARAIERDGNRCSVGRLLGGDCHGILDVDHIIPLSSGGAEYELDNLLTVCHRHHPQREAVWRAVQDARGWRRCPPHHRHRTREAREICERRLNRSAA